MKDSLLKQIEVWFRRLVLHALEWIFHRHNPIPDQLDYNTCKVLFIRQDRIGDVLISTPLLSLLKKHYPRIQLDILLGRNNYSVLEHEPMIHRRWLYKKALWEIIRLIKELRGERYDFIVDLTDNASTTSTIFCLLGHAKWNIGIQKENSFAYDVSVPMLSRRDIHIVERIAQLLVPFHIDPQKETLTLHYTTSAESDFFAQTSLTELGLIGHPIIGVNISAGTATRFWGVENFTALLQHINATYPTCRSLLVYQPADEDRAKKIADSTPNARISPVTSTFDQFASLVKQLTILITPDTAAVHLASAFNIPALVLYVQSNKKLRIWEPYGIDCECLVTDIDDLTNISVTEVKDALDKLVKRNIK